MALPKAFTFEQDGRTYTCSAEERTTEPKGTWWWFSVSSDQQRYAPFEAAPGDTQQSVKTRVVAFYEHRLWARAQPVVPRERHSGPGRPAGSGKPAVAPAPAAEE